MVSDEIKAFGTEWIWAVCDLLIEKEVMTEQEIIDKVGTYAEE